VENLNFIGFEWHGLLDSVTDIAFNAAKKQAEGVAGAVATKLRSTISAQWSAVDWSSTRNTYRKNLEETLSTVKVLGNPRSINIEETYTDVYVFDRISALKRFAGTLEEIQNPEDNPHDGVRLPALEVPRCLLVYPRKTRCRKNNIPQVPGDPSVQREN
jgi:hypothetical protein